MCGIYGLISAKGNVDVAFIKHQRDLLTHRGPDDAGVWIDKLGKVGLAHRRLSILDLSSAGHQPMFSQDNQVVIVFNGEIYNYQELRCELIKLGFTFKTSTDTEIILAAWQHWRERCVNKFNGMFAFVIYDAGTQHNPPTIFMARDRVGKKPLYYAYNNQHLEFASELKAISKRGEINLTALNYYLALGYIPSDLCIANGVAKLPPACYAQLDLNTFDFKVTQYWVLPKNNPLPKIDGEMLAEQAAKLIEDATRIRLVADVPVGILLSGGLDSSLVTAAAARVSSKPIETFTIALPGSKLDESSYAQLVAKHFGTHHHVLEMTKSGLDELENFSPFIDEPIADSSILPSFVVSRLTRANVTVALGGDGGDELFGGYNDYTNSLADANRLRHIPTTLLKVMSELSACLPAGVKGRNRITSLSHGATQQMIWGSPYFDIALRKRLFCNSVLKEIDQDITKPELFLLNLFNSGQNPIDQMTRTHFGSILPDDFLVKVDRTSMANSLEMRAPLLDYRLVEFAFGSIPSEWKVHNGETRRIQKLIAKKWLPKELDTNRKQGFSIPLDDWLRQLPKSWHESWLDRLPNTLNKDEAKSLVDGLHKGRANGSRIFALLCLGICISNLYKV
ncbi:MAG: asparagine synthase (glutamine-hydrolyzing) [Methylophilus sp.]|nr:asparagine synthase (glutamine-hydrolyzing) [Methylophilus sp.]